MGGEAAARFAWARFARASMPARSAAAESWPRTMDVITQGVLHCSHAVLPGMVARGGGVIVNIVSDAGRVGEPRLVPYSMAKGGVEDPACRKDVASSPATSGAANEVPRAVV